MAVALAISHISPDGDAIGSLLGFGWVLRSANPNGFTQSAGTLTLACADPVPAQFQWLPGASEIISAPPAGPWDVVVGLDASDGACLGSPFRPADFGAAPIVVIDHHVTNLRFGTLNYVDPSAVATSQIVVDLADALGAPIGQEAATCLLTGLVMDTLGFRTSNVTPQVMAVAMRLMEAGANLAEITERSLNHKPLNTLRLWGQALANVQINGRVVWASITRQMREQVARAAQRRWRAGEPAHQRARSRDCSSLLGNRRGEDRDRFSGQIRLRRVADRVEPGRRRASSGIGMHDRRAAGRRRGTRAANVGAG